MLSCAPVRASLDWASTPTAPSASVPTSAPPALVCPLEGCDAARRRAIETSASPDACASSGDAPCAGATPAECTAHALDAWSSARDERARSCVARALTAACDLGDVEGCGFSGRMRLEGHDVARDIPGGLARLDRACSGGMLLACRVAVRWLADPEHLREASQASGAADASDPSVPMQLRARLDLQLDCLTGVPEACLQLGLALGQGREGFPLDLEGSARAYERGCAIGERVACNNLGDAFEYGSGVPRDLARSVALYDRACRGGEALGCANLGHLLENGEGAPRDVARARVLYRDACAGGTDYACIHEQMAATGSPSTPAEAARFLERWERACKGGDARGCAFVGILYEDGPDGLHRDSARSLQAMTRACQLGDARACAWVRGRGP